MKIWFQEYALNTINHRSQNTLAEYLEIEFIEIGDNFLTAKMPVGPKTVQPERILHGGASAALAETIASTAANLVIDSKRYYCVGVEINANHVRNCKSGFVIGTSQPLHLGKKTQVWETKILSDSKLICISRMTTMVLTRESPSH